MPSTRLHFDKLAWKPETGLDWMLIFPETSSWIKKKRKKNGEGRIFYSIFNQRFSIRTFTARYSWTETRSPDLVHVVHLVAKYSSKCRTFCAPSVATENKSESRRDQTIFHDSTTHSPTPTPMKVAGVGRHNSHENSIWTTTSTTSSREFPRLGSLSLTSRIQGASCGIRSNSRHRMTVLNRYRFELVFGGGGGGAMVKSSIIR